jgi:hypothetical protein
MITTLFDPNFTPEKPMEAPEVFDEQYYLEHNPDVKQAISTGTFPTGKYHYDMYGRAEGRKHKFNLRDEIEAAHAALVTHVESYTDPLTLKGYVAPSRAPKKKLNMVDVPLRFKPVQSIEYPEGNKIPFERYFEQYFVENRPETLRKYLPVHFCAFIVNHGQGTYEKQMAWLQKYIDELPRDEKYFCICQHDNGLMFDVSHLDILVYSMGNNTPSYYPIPLISQPLNCTPFEVCKKDILYSFVGADTHTIRWQLVNELKSEWVRFEKISHDAYVDELKRTTFSLCPRGFGITSFRLFESLHFGAIPVYISDDGYWEPFNIPFETYGIKLKSSDIKNLDSILAQINIPEKQAAVKEFYNNYCVYSSCADKIIQTLL